MSVDNGNISQTNIQNNLCVNSRNVNAVISELTALEIKSILFLLIPEIGTNNFLSLKNESQECLCLYLKQLLHLFHMDFDIALAELLSTVKQYRLLKILGFCKHNCNVKSRIVKPYWKMLYHICENLDDDELKKLKQKYSVPDIWICAEDVLCYLNSIKKINESEKLDNFISVLSDIQPKLVPIVEDYIALESYYFIRDPTSINPCGLAIIINQQMFHNNNGSQPFYERSGTEIDKEKLENLWRQFGFKIETHENLKAEEIQELFDMLYFRTENTDIDVFVCCLLSHGDKGVIYGVDCQPVQIERLTECVSKCTYLNEKPKLFFIQACQGHQHQQSPRIINSDRNCDSVPFHVNISSQTENDNYIHDSDIYRVMSTIPGYVTYRFACLGSPFIDKLVNKLMKDGDKERLEWIMSKVNNELTKSHIPQMPMTLSTLRKCVIFKRMCEN